MVTSTPDKRDYRQVGLAGQLTDFRCRPSELAGQIGTLRGNAIVISGSSCKRGSCRNNYHARYRVLVVYFNSSISPGFQVLLNHGSSGL